MKRNKGKKGEEELSAGRTNKSYRRDATANKRARGRETESKKAAREENVANTVFARPRSYFSFLSVLICPSSFANVADKMSGKQAAARAEIKSTGNGGTPHRRI